MRAATIKYQILSGAATLVLIIIALVPFHAFLTVWLSSAVGHYTLLRLWKEILLLAAVLCVIYLLLTDSKVRFHTLTRRLVWLIAIYAAILLMWGIAAYDRHEVTEKAMFYGWLLDGRLLLIFVVAWALSVRTARLQGVWRQLLLAPAGIVVIFGLLQLFALPHDVLRHFGYGPHTIPAVETVNNNAAYPRLTSTLRGANPLGTYLIIVIAGLATLLVQRPKLRSVKGACLLGAVVVLVFSYSRSALVGAILSVLFVLGLSLRTSLSRRVGAIAATLVIVLLVIAGLSLRNNVHVQNLLLHTQTHSAVRTTSNGNHLSAMRIGFDEALDDPLGAGPGTAGPASIYNEGHPSRIAENYYIQLAQEIGWFGLAVFLVINVGVGYLLWARRGHPLAVALLASLIGISFVNLLSHAWTDDTLAYVWWGLAGIAMALPAKGDPKPAET